MSMSRQQQTIDEDDWEAMMAHLVTEDETPVDNRFSERQQRLLPSLLFSSWEEGKPFEAVSNVGLFYSLHGEPPVVPDFMLSLGVEPRPVTSAKADRSYMTWIYGKAPDLVVEVVSNREGGELDRKMEIYAKVRVTYYVVYDPFRMLGERELRAYRLAEGRYVEMVSASWLPEVGLGLALWDGKVEEVEDRWLRFVEKDGTLLATPDEKEQAARKAATQANSRADEANSRASEANSRADEANSRAAEASFRAEAALAEVERARLEREAIQRRIAELEQRLEELQGPSDV